MTSRPSTEATTRGLQAPAVADSPAPERLGDHVLGEEIGRGGMGVVHRARQASLDREVAVKILRGGALASDADRQRFRVEAASAAALRHPGIVKVHGAGEEDGHLFFAMELVEGESLQDRLGREGPLPPREAAAIVARVARAVDHAHSQGVLHRDLKPANVLLDVEGRPVVTDFGIARLRRGPGLESGSELDEGLIGTPSYMAPEQVSGRDWELGPWTDVHGLGALLFALLGGQPPFRGENVAQVVAQVLETPAPRLRDRVRDLPRELEAIVQHCLEKDPRRRYASASELAVELERFLAGEPVEVLLTGPAHRFRRWLSRRPSLTITWCALSLFYLMEWGLFFLQDDVNLRFHLRITIILTTWAVGALLMQLGLDRARNPVPWRFAWAAMECVLIGAALMVADGPESPMRNVLLLLVAASVFRRRPALSWFQTLGAMVVYGIVSLHALHARPDLVLTWDGVLVPLTSLLVMGVMADQVSRRLRAASPDA
ncbi:MAG: serine/threonine-protein kinase [Acidobacteriota bacterium]